MKNENHIHNSWDDAESIEFVPRHHPINNLLRQLIFGGDDVPIKNLLLTGVFVWSIYSALQIYLKGVILDETILPAQIINGFVQYPQGHPYQIFFPQAFNFFYYFASILFKLIPDKFLLSVIFNFTFLFLSTFLPFAFTTTLTKRPIWGFFACAILLSESGVNFSGVYPIWVYPTFYSHSHIALQIALLVIVLLFSKLWKFSGFLLGLLPSIHPAMAAIIWPWAVAYIWWGNSSIDERKKITKEMLYPFILGIAICLLIGVVTLYRHFTVNLAFPYNEPINGNLIYQQFTTRTNVHTQDIPFMSLAYLINPIAYFLFVFLIAFVSFDRMGGQKLLSASIWLLIFGAIVWVTIYGLALYQKFIGPLEFFISLLKPYRYSNLTATLLIPLSVTLIGTIVEKLTVKARQISFGLLVFLVLSEGLMLKLNRDFVFHELIFISWGVIFGLLFFHYLNSFRNLITVSFGFILLIMCMFLVQNINSKIIDFTMLLSFVITFLVLKLGEWLTRNITLDWGKIQLSSISLLLTICILTSIAGMTGFRIWDQWNGVYDSNGNWVGRWDELTQFDIQLDDWLDKNARPGEMILPFILPRTELQAKTDHPVLFEMETLFLMDFIPGLSSPIGLMCRDLFGVDYSNINELNKIGKDGKLSLSSPVWANTWIHRKRSEWQALGKKYNFRLVLSLNTVPIDLPKAISGPVWTLYTIP